MFWRRTPRAVYRVYGEDEYLDAGEVGVEEDTNPTFGGEYASDDQHTTTHRRPLGSRSGRLVGIGLLVGVTVCALGLVVANVLHRPSVATRSGFVQGTRKVPPSYASTGLSAGATVGVTVSPEAKRHRAPTSHNLARVKAHSSVGGAAPTDRKPDTHASGALALTHPLPTATRWVVLESSGALAEPHLPQLSTSPGSPPEAASLVGEREFGFEQ
jgi:hypothetical protein